DGVASGLPGAQAAVEKRSLEAEVIKSKPDACGGLDRVIPSIDNDFRFITDTELEQSSFKGIGFGEFKAQSAFAGYGNVAKGYQTRTGNVTAVVICFCADVKDHESWIIEGTGEFVYRGEHVLGHERNSCESEHESHA